ncbi:MAG: hypothetical protein ACRCT7_10040 [Shewanella sp.]
MTVTPGINQAFIDAMARGVSYQEITTLPCECAKLSANQFSIRLTQGLNRQIRRMCQALGFKVIDLQRVGMMTLSLDGLDENNKRPLEAAEIKALYHACGLKLT